MSCGRCSVAVTRLLSSGKQGQTVSASAPAPDRHGARTLIARAASDPADDGYARRLALHLVAHPVPRPDRAAELSRPAMRDARP
jgi:hypothetical protein